MAALKNGYQTHPKTHKIGFPLVCFSTIDNATVN